MEGSQPEFYLKLIMEAGVVGGIAVTVIRFLMTRIVKQMDDSEEARRADHNQMRIWFASFSRTLLVFEKQFLLHDATVHGINPSTGSSHDERMSTAEKKFDALRGDFDAAIAKIDGAIISMEKEIERRAAK